MTVSWRTVSGLLSMACCVGLLGCYGSSTDKPSVKAPADSGAASKGDAASTALSEDMHGDHSHGTALSPEDQKIADLQKVCPVSDEPLGGPMGPPVKLVVKGEPIFICCKSCTEEVNADPDKFLAKVAQLKKANSQ